MNESFKTESAEILDADESRSMKMQRNKNAAKHRHYLIKAALKDVDLRRIDRRTALGAEMARRREQIIADAGGQENLTELKADLIEKYLRTVILIENVDSYRVATRCNVLIHQCAVPFFTQFMNICSKDFVAGAVRFCQLPGHIHYLSFTSHTSLPSVLSFLSQ